MSIDKVQILRSLKATLPSFQGPVQSFNDANSGFVDAILDYRSSGKKSGQPFAMAGQGISKLHAATFEAGSLLRHQFLSNVQSVYFYGQRFMLRGLTDIFENLESAELIDFTRFNIAISQLTLFDLDDVNSKRTLQSVDARTIDPYRDFESDFAKMLFFAFSFSSVSADLLNIIQDNLKKDEKTASKNVNELDKVLAALNEVLSKIQGIDESQPLGIEPMIIFKIINQPAGARKKELEDQFLAVTSWRTDYWKERKGLQEHKEHLEADFVKWGERESKKVMEDLASIYAEFVSVIKNHAHQLGLHTPIRDFESDKDLIKLNKSRLISLAKIYLELAKYTEFTLLDAPGSIHPSHIQEGLLYANKYSSFVQHLLKNVQENTSNGSS